MSSSDSAASSSSASSSSSSGGHSDDDAPGGGASPLPPAPPPPASAPPDVAGSLELAQVAHFCAAFRAPLKLSHFSRTELQAALENARDPDERQVALLAELHFKLTRDQTGVKLERMIQDWERAVARKLADNWQLEFAANPMANASYAELSVHDRIRVLNALCLWKAESCAEIRKHIATLQQEDPKAFDRLRGSEIGTDDRGVSYWYFDDACWVYAEDKPQWQREKRQPLYLTEFANGKRIRLSINFQASDVVTSQPQLAVDVKRDAGMKEELKPKHAVKAETSVSTTVDVKDEKLQMNDATLKEEKKEAAATAAVAVVEAPPPPSASLVKEEVRPANRKMDINLICGSPASDDTSVKSEKCTSLSDTQGSSDSNGTIKVERTTNGSGVAPPCPSDKPLATGGAAVKSEASNPHDEEDATADLDSEPASQHRDTPGSGSAKKRFIVDDDNTDSSDSGSEKKAAKKKAHAQEKHISFASSPAKKKQKIEAASPVEKETTAASVKEEAAAPVKESVAAPVKETMAAPAVDVEMPPAPAKRSELVAPAEATSGSADLKTTPTELAVDTTSTDKPSEPNGAPATENFDINCECCQKDYDMRYLDPPLVERPAGEWRCFECLVNDARGWPRRRKLTASPTAKAEPVADERAKSNSRKSSGSSSGKRSRPSSSKSSSSKTAAASSSGSKRKKSSGHSTSTSKKSSSSSKKHKKKKKSSSSSSHSHHHHRRSSSSSHHRRRHHHEYSKLLAAFQARNSERLSIEAYRVQETSRYDAGYLEGPTSWRVVSSSVEGLRALIESLSGGSLEQERLRSHLISILKAQEKLEEERIKRQELAWQILPRRQSSRIAIGKMRTQSSGSERSDDAFSDDDDDEDAGKGRRKAQRSGRTRSSDAAQTEEESKNQLALDRASRARRRHHIVEETDEHDDEEDEQDASNPDAPSPGNWINWSILKRNKRSLSTMCLAAVDRLLKEEIADLFSRPVDPEFDGCPDYLTIISSPMDLGTIRTRLRSGSYMKWETFKSDVELVWSNCRAFNGTDMMISQYADTLDALFQEMCRVAEKRGAASLADKPEDGGGASSDDNNGNDDGHSSSSAESKAESKTSVNKEWTESSESESSGSSDASESSSDHRGKARSSRSGASGRSKSTTRSPSSKSGRAATPRASRSRRAASKKQGSSESDAFSSDASDASDEVRRPTKRAASGPARTTRGRQTASTPPKSNARSAASPRGSVPPPPPPPAHTPAKLKSPVSKTSPRPAAKAPVPRATRLRVSESSSSDSDGNGKASSSSSSSSSDSSDDDDSDDGSDVDLHARRKDSSAPSPATKKSRATSDRSSAQPPPPPPPPSPPSAAAASSGEREPPPPPPPPPSEKKSSKTKPRSNGGAGASSAGKKVPPRVAALKLDRIGDGAQAQTHSPTLLRSYPSPSSSSSSYFSSSADSDSSDSGDSDGGSE